MRHYNKLTVAENLEYLLNDLYYKPDFIASPRGMEVREILNCCIEVDDPMQNLFYNPFRSSQKKYIAAELLFYFSGTNKVDFIENYASLWKQLKDKDGKANSAYGYLLFTERNRYHFTQYQWVIESLKKDKDSRQAFMHFNRPYHQYLENKDQVCTLQALFHIRENKLYMTVTMRSNDIIWGFMNDYTFFTVLQYQVFLHLKKYYPELEIGSYTHISHSMHLYEKHYDLVKNTLTELIKPESLLLSNTSILDEKGKWLPKYIDIFDGVLYNKVSWMKESDNDLLNWCVNELR